MSTITPKQLEQIRVAITEALQQVKSHYGLESLRAGNCTYTPGGAFTFKVEGQIEGGKSKEASMYEQWMRINADLPPLGTQLTNSNGTYTIEGMNTTGSKVYARRAGVVYLLRTQDVERMWRQVTGKPKDLRGLHEVPPPPRSAA